MSDNEKVVIVENLSKTFKIPTDKRNGIKQVVTGMFKGKKGYREFKVLNDISFEINKGDFFGIVGRNGSGKSTLLKILAGIYTPDSGRVHIGGSLTPFIELGVGFNPELTAQENVFLNGALLGFSRSEIQNMYDEIVGFAELEGFMSEKLKNFSSGMQVRLAFSIAIKSNSDILLFDEVLAVGDSDFQLKCFNYFKEIKEDKNRTVILVTHDMAAVQKFCTNALILHDGNVASYGSPSEVAITYKVLNFPDKSDAVGSEEKVKLKIIEPISKGNVYEHNDTIEIDVEWDESLEGVKNVGVAVLSNDGAYVFGTNTKIDKVPLRTEDKNIRYRLNLNLGGGTYIAKAAAFGETDDDTIYFNDIGLTFHMKDKEDSWGGITNLQHKWIKKD